MFDRFVIAFIKCKPLLGTPCVKCVTSAEREAIAKASRQYRDHAINSHPNPSLGTQLLRCSSAQVITQETTLLMLCLDYFLQCIHDFHSVKIVFDLLRSIQ